MGDGYGKPQTGRLIDFEALRAPFNPWELEWRAGSVSPKGSCTLLCYLTSRAVMDRLDEVVGPANWADSYERGPDGGILCTLSIQVSPGEWVSKQDAAENTNIEAVKGGISGALKRCAVKWGIGRYLYGLETRWHKFEGGPQDWANGRGIDISSKGNHVGWVKTPTLPAWALPAAGSTTAPPEQAEPATDPAKAEHHPSWPEHQSKFCAQMQDFGGYNAVRDYCLSRGWPKPSTLTLERRLSLLHKLQSGEITIP